MSSKPDPNHGIESWAPEELEAEYSAEVVLGLEHGESRRTPEQRIQLFARALNHFERQLELITKAIAPDSPDAERVLRDARQQVAEAKRLWNDAKAQFESRN